MAIQQRRGRDADLIKNRLLPGEFAVSADTGTVRVCASAGRVITLATKEDLQELLDTSPQLLQSIREALVALQQGTVLTGILGDIAGLKADIVTTNNNLSNLSVRNLLPNATWNLGRGNWTWAANTAEILSPESDKPDSHILRLLPLSVGQQATTTYHPTPVFAGVKYAITFDIRVQGYAANSMVLDIRNLPTPSTSSSQGNSLEFRGLNKAGLGVNGNTDGFVRVGTEFIPTVNGYLDIVPRNSSAGAETIDFREIMVTEGPHNEYLPRLV